MKSFDMDWLLSPMSLDEYLSKGINNAFHLKRSRDRYDSMLNVDDIDRIITTMAHRPFSMAKDGFVLPSKSHKDGEDKDRIVDYYNQGATIILDNLERSWEKLSQLCIACMKSLPYTKLITANVYLTPPSSQAFKVHADYQDVFILQLAGSKSWRVYKADIKYPINDKHIVLNEGFPTKEDEVLNVDLYAGDLLHVPRGFAHEVRTRKEFSLHITLTVIPYTWSDVFQKILENATDRSDEMRKTIPIDFFSGPQNTLQLEINRLTNILQRQDPGKLREGLLLDRLKSSSSNFRGFFNSVIGPMPKLTEDTIFKSNTFIPKIIRKTGKKCLKIITNKGEFEVEGVSSEIDYIFSNNEFTVSDLPGRLSVNDKLVLVDSLVRQGLVNVVTERSSIEPKM